MLLFPPRLEIGDQEGFSKEKDIFNRSTTGKGLTNLVCKVSEPLVIAVDNEWGTGKTTFLKMWAGELRKLGIPVIYFDAFQHDYVEDAFTAIASEIISLASEKQKQNEPAAEQFLKTSMSAAKVLLRTGLKLGVKFGTAGLLSAADFNDVAGDFAKEASELEDKYLGELLTKQSLEKEAIQSFRDALQSLPSLLSSPPENNNSDLPKSRPLIIIIDELDRCRPTFALQILERIKHFFSVPSVHFILGTHLGQLRNSVSAVYGSGIDSGKYLQKFINLTLHLAEGALHPHQRTTAIYIDYLFSAMGFETTEVRTDFAKDYFLNLAYHSNLSLRAIEKIMGTFAISVAYKPKNTFCPDPIMIGLCALKTLSPDLYVRAQSGSIHYSDVSDLLCLGITPLRGKEHVVAHMAKIWRYYSDRSIAEDNPDFSGVGRQLWDFHIDRWDAVAHVARTVVDRLSE